MEAISERETSETKGGEAEMMRLLVCSDLRRSLVLSLQKGPSSLADLRKETGASSTAAIHALRELEREHLTYENDKRQYALTNIGKIIALKLEDLNNAISVLNAHNNFWLAHDMTGIPEVSLKALGSLEESYIIASTSTDIFKVYSTFKTLVENANHIKGIAPFFVPELIDIFVDLVLKGKSIELVVTSDVFDKMTEVGDRQELKRALEGSLKLFKTKQNPKVGLTVTDYFLSLGFFRWDGVYDYTSDLLSYNNQAIEWGTDLFDYYLAASEEITLDK